MFSWLQTFIYPFTIVAKGMFNHDTVAMVIPDKDHIPPEGYIDVTYIPVKGKKSLIIGLKLGRSREYNPATGLTGPEILTFDAGIWHSTPDYMVWHWDPLVESIIELPVYPQAFFVSTEKPYYLRLVNNTDKYIWIDATFYYIEFPRAVRILGRSVDVEDAFHTYMNGIIELATEGWKLLSKITRVSIRGLSAEESRKIVEEAMRKVIKELRR